VFWGKALLDIQKYNLYSVETTNDERIGK